MNINDFQIFHSVVESGGFTAAAKSLGLPTATVSRKIVLLEKELSLTLLTRSTRCVTPSKAGLIFYQRTKLICADLDNTLEEIHHNQTALEGRIRVQLLPAAKSLIPYFYQFQLMYPGILLDLVIESQNICLIKHGIDLAIKVGEQQDSNLICRKARTIMTELVASPEYLQNYGTPNCLEDLNEHNCLRFRDSNNVVESTWTFSKGEKLNDITGNFISNDISLIHQASLLGQGVALLPRVLCKDDIITGKLISLLSANKKIHYDIWIIYPMVKYQSNAVKALVDFLANSAQNETTS
ncbi:LysR family transcriptional regulator [Vibrio splendidus]|uniref:LysR family transcriptional regulator n=1 Tax=Vibrio splendidus TaxID=29497 RepID=UPI0022369ACC|nr:LysR family transcriptional regulator [Vibrio splendidus]MCW4438865.1 LysR family transcriptional regulator [Vibrio splendidus]